MREREMERWRDRNKERQRYEGKRDGNMEIWRDCDTGRLKDGEMNR